MPPARNYWLDLFTGTTWDEFIKAGGTISGFRDSRWNSVQKIKKGDYLLCYLTGLSRFIGVLEVVSKPFKDNKTIWSIDSFPCRVKVKDIVTLTPETALPIHDLKDQLSIFQNMVSPHAWTGKLRGSPVRWKVSDGEIILDALLKERKDPTERPFDVKKLERKPAGFKAKIGTVTVPEDDFDLDKCKNTNDKSLNIHTEVEYLLLKLGKEMNFDVWVAKNDRNKEFNGIYFADHFNIKDSLPLQFDEATNKTIEYIDVLWLKGNAIIAAFEVESTTSIYSGILRMSDLLSMQPNINMPLYIVAPDDRRQKVFIEVNRPTFSRLSPPLSEVCRYLSFSALIDKTKEYSSVLRYLKPEFLDEISEECKTEDY